MLKAGEPQLHSGGWRACSAEGGSKALAQLDLAWHRRISRFTINISHITTKIRQPLHQLKVVYTGNTHTP